MRFEFSFTVQFLFSGVGGTKDVQKAAERITHLRALENAHQTSNNIMAPILECIFVERVAVVDKGSRIIGKLLGPNFHLCLALWQLFS